MENGRGIINKWFAANITDHVLAKGRKWDGQQVVLQQTDKIMYKLRAE
jgi:hypothetical protein